VQGRAAQRQRWRAEHRQPQRHRWLVTVRGVGRLWWGDWWGIGRIGLALRRVEAVGVPGQDAEVRDGLSAQHAPPFGCGAGGAVRVDPAGGSVCPLAE
jgi:hypothetical protein